MARRTLRTLLFLLAGVPIGMLALAVLVAGWVVVPILAITPLVIPALVAFRWAVGGVAWLDGQVANRLLDTSVEPTLRSPGPSGFWRSGLNVLSDASFWQQQAYLMVRQSVGLVVAIAEWSLLVASLGAVTLPIWYRWSAHDLVGWDADTLGRALLGVPIGIAGLAIALLLVGPIAAVSRSLVEALLGDVAQSVTPAPAVVNENRRRTLTVHAIATGSLNAFLIAIWAFTSHGYFWPKWTLLALGLPLAIHAWVVFVEERPDLMVRGRMTRTIALEEGIALCLSIFFVLIWAFTGGGYFWPLWPILALALVFTIHAVVEFSRRGSRISQLEKSRAGVVEQQETDLARIERDLHDGAQARLVALGMSLGMAKQKLASDPAAAEALLAEAQRGTRDALEELRSLARGIRPPILADRGLAAAIGALADRTPLEVNVAVDLSRRPPNAVESAAYFVAAEGLANAGKHANATRVDIAVREDGRELVVEILDDGNGGADIRGTGLQGLARRVEALDGRLTVTSPDGGPTTITAVIPCAS